MKFIKATIISLHSLSLFSQNLPDHHRILTINYEDEKAEVLIQSYPNETAIKKPLLVFLQGSLARPIGTKTKDSYQVFAIPFQKDSLLKKYHIAVIAKPFIPAFAEEEQLNDSYVFVNDEGEIPIEFLKRDNLTYMVKRNNHIINQLLEEVWIDGRQLIISGHSQGSTIGAFIARENKKVTHLIYASGNPYGRILSTLGQIRSREDSINQTRSVFSWWHEAIQNADDDFNESGGDSFKTTVSFNTPTQEILLNLTIPVLINYGSKDYNTPYIDLLRIESIRNGNLTIEFKEYTGTEHNFFPKDAEGNIDYSVNNWNQVSEYWLEWLENNK